MQINDVIKACEALTNIGKKPTIALVKTRITGKIPLALIVKGIQQFQSNSECVPTLTSESKLTDSTIDAITDAEKRRSCEDRVSSLENEIAKMSACITALQAQVKVLTEQ